MLNPTILACKARPRRIRPKPARSYPQIFMTSPELERAEAALSFLGQDNWQSAFPRRYTIWVIPSSGSGSNA